jgi:hypothetical protein
MSGWVERMNKELHHSVVAHDNDIYLLCNSGIPRHRKHTPQRQQISDNKKDVTMRVAWEPASSSARSEEVVICGGAPTYSKTASMKERKSSYACTRCLDLQEQRRVAASRCFVVMIVFTLLRRHPDCTAHE